MTGQIRGQRIHMMGIGGAGVSALAAIAHRWGAQVSGCDRARSDYMDRVENAGVVVYVGHDASHSDNIDRLVVSSAIPSTHPEIARARERGTTVMLRGQLLGELTQARTSVVVAGAHGKSTTTAMLGRVAADAGLDPSVALGAVDRTFGGNARLGDGDWFIVEGDESDRTLADLHARIAIVTNVERDHHHTFASDEELDELFRGWLSSLGEQATLILGPGERIDRIATGLPGRVVRFGEDPARTREIGAQLAVPGIHNALNAEAAMCAAQQMGIDADGALRTLGAFDGIGRRFDVLGTVGGVTVVDDYAHHPTEVAATIAAARERSDHVAVVFQPHLFSRTQELADQFATALAGADHVTLLPVYGAREDPIPGVSEHSIVQAAGDAGSGWSTPGWEPQSVSDAELADLLTSCPDGLLITMGAGDVTQLGPRLLNVGSATLG